MQYRQLGNSDIQISVVTLGTWVMGGWMWGGSNKSDAIRAIHAAIDQGITTIDTAPVYGFGLSEEIIGEAIKGRKEHIQILTKYGLRWDSTEGEFHFHSEKNDGQKVDIYKNSRIDSIVAECEQSLTRLGIDCIDLYQCHWRDHTTPLEITMEAMATLYKEGKIKAAGVSNFTTEEIAECCKHFPIVSSQPPFSMVKRDAQQELIPFCHSQGIGTIVYSPLQRGLLTGKITPDYTFQPGDHRPTTLEFQPENIQRTNNLLEKIKAIADKYRASLTQVVIQWTIQQEGITAALVGARTESQLKENAGAMDFTLTDEDISAINTWIGQQGF